VYFSSPWHLASSARILYEKNKYHNNRIVLLILLILERVLWVADIIAVVVASPLRMPHEQYRGAC
jgi:hypothetical protein